MSNVRHLKSFVGVLGNRAHITQVGSYLRHTAKAESSNDNGATKSSGFRKGLFAGISVRGSHKIRMVSKIEAVIVDLSGTLHIEDTAIGGAPEALAKLRRSGLKIRFVTNTTKESLRLLHERLKDLRFDIEREEIFTSLTAARQLVEKRRLRPLLFLEDSAKEDFIGINVENPNAVLIGLATSCFNYDSMNNAFRLIMDGAPLIAIHKARYLKRKDGLLHLGPGMYVTGLEYATDTKAEVVGKPEKSFFIEAIRDLSSVPSRTIMIGDDVRDDVGGAMTAGMMGILVQTGKYRNGDEDKIDPRPTATCQDFPSAVEYILEHL